MILSFRVIKMSFKNATNVSWSEMVTGLLSSDLPSRPSSVLTPEKGCPVRFHKNPPDGKQNEAKNAMDCLAGTFHGA
jgi:hypothetical protein